MTTSFPIISVIFPAKNEGDNVKKTLDSLFAASSNIKYEVIIVDDGSNDGCCDFLSHYPKRHKVQRIRTEGIGAANARNLGAKHANGHYFVFCDAHLFFTNMWMDKLIAPLQAGKTDAVCPAIADANHPASIGYGQTLKPNLIVDWNKKSLSMFDTAVLPGGCLMISKKVFNDVGGFETGFKTWGYEDIELSIKLWLFGYKCSVVPNVRVLHLFRKSHPYTLSNSHIYYNLMRMAYSHFNHNRIKKSKALIKNENSVTVEKDVLQDGVLQQRNAYFKKRKYDDNWYFKKFNISF
ncbi:glycosyltransferase involved in cell wall biosynthesis [Salibacterium salarium]|uniref:glycosyltransferase n=1 Tax=Salibacterium salarium TaxID=284579 RepID=UPI002783E084|nr:glycosyltransferase [Salibacterium salarium]MDQ0300705.1 glycosyltransferase involved in cell wall biosynthesis [Salibacterium salarium]